MEGEGNKNKMADDPKDLWERLQESGRKRMKLMEDKKNKLQKEIDTMNSIVAAANVSDDDIIEINAGGKIIAVLRSTLTVAPDTVLAYMFSGRWEESLKRDSSGRVFLNNDPELIELIVNYLRTKVIEDPSSKEVNVGPEIPKGKEHAFRVLLNYFGLTDFFDVFITLDIDNIDVVQASASNTTVTKSKNKIQLSKNIDDYNFIVCKPKLDSSGKGFFWKVTIDASLSSLDSMFLGIIGNLDATDPESGVSFHDPTCYGWFGGHETYHEGKNRHGESGWTAFTQGECLYFHLKGEKITMFSVQKNQKFTIDITTTVDAYYIHLNMYFKGTKLTLEPLNEEERTRVL